MGTQRQGYFVADGTRIPSVTTILKRFKESGGLVHWAWDLGMKQQDYREVRDKAADIGTIAHSAVEAHIRGKPFVWMPGENYDKARIAFNSFLEWAEHTSLTAAETELPLVSEKYRFGGTLDAMLISSKLSLGDWKTSNKVYSDYLCQIAAYGILWEENFPDRPITGGYHLLRFDKNYGDFHHHKWNELETAKKQFLLFREAYELDKELKARCG